MKHLIILTKSWTNRFGRKYPIGQKIPCDNELGSFLLKNGYGEEFGKVDLSERRKKVKTKFFKNKD